MNTRIKMIITVTSVAAISFAAHAQVQGRNARPERKQRGFNCPVCNSPCVSKAEIQQQQRQRLNTANKRRSGPNQPENARQRPRAGNRQQQAFSRDQRGPAGQQREMRFDLDGDGQLSNAERAARKAYVQARRSEQEDAPAGRSRPRPPVDE